MLKMALLKPTRGKSSSAESMEKVSGGVSSDVFLCERNTTHGSDVVLDLSR